MKKFYLLPIFIFAGLFFFNPVLAAEKIDNFDASITINQDSSINVSEKIRYDFGIEQRHGIFRDIPIKYKARGGNYNLRISGISVADENGIPHKFTTSYLGNNIEIKIGDADKYVTGEKVYVINYKVKRALNYFEDHDELYWNVTGNGWPVAIMNSSVKVSLWNGSSSNIQKACFAGPYGTTDQCAQWPGTDGSEAFFTSGMLDPGEGMTVVFGFPKDVVKKPGAVQNFLEILRDNWILFFPVAVLFAMFYLWYTRGRDPKGRGTIIAEYDAPDGLSPAEVGTVMDNKAENKDISAEIINLAVRGYLKINKTEKKGIVFDSEDYLLEKLKDEKDLENTFQQDIMRNIFSGNLDVLSKIDTTDETGKLIVQKGMVLSSVRLSELKNKFYKDLDNIKDQIYQSVIKKGYYKDNPHAVKKLYSAIAIGIIFIAIFIFRGILGGLGIASCVVSGIIIGIFGFIMPARTRKGALAREYVLGLKEYLSVAEKDRIKFHNAPEKNPEHFEKLLPYAMVLGVEKEWAEQFKDMYLQNPSWYNDSSGASFSSLVFINSLNSFSSSANSAFSSAPSSASGGGSGFSGGGGGGGFGGGGGGSW